MGFFNRNTFETRAGAQFQATKGYVNRQAWTAPAAASATSVLNAHAADGSTQTAAAQPDFARTLQYVSSGTDTTHTVTVNGTDIRGNALAETITLNGTTVVHGTKAFASVTSVVLPSVGSNNVSVGTDTGLGLNRIMKEDSYIQGNSDGTIEATRATLAFLATAISGNYVKFNTAPNGAHNFVAWYLTSELTTAA